MKFFLTFFLIFALTHSAAPAPEAALTDGQENSIRLIVQEALNQLLEKDNAQTLVQTDNAASTLSSAAADRISSNIPSPFVRDMVFCMMGCISSNCPELLNSNLFMHCTNKIEKEAEAVFKTVTPVITAKEDAGDVKDSADDTIEKAKDYLGKKAEEAADWTSEKKKDAEDWLNKKKQQAEDFINDDKNQAQAKADLQKIKEMMTHYYNNEDDNADKAAEDVTPVNIQPVNANEAKALHSQASIWSAILVLLFVFGIAGTITCFVQEKEVLTFSEDSEMEKLFNQKSYYQSQKGRTLY